MNLYFTCESRGTLKSFTLFISVKAITKLNLGHIDISEIKTKKISRRCSRSLDNTELGHFTFLFSRGRQRNVQRIITHVHSQCFCSLKLLFGDALVAVANRRVLRKVSNVCCVTVSGYKSGVTLQNQTHSLRTLYRRTVNKTT